jgi:hypothetical protein
MKRFDLYPAKVMGNSAYGSAEMLGWLVHEHGIEPHVTVFDKSARRDGTFSRDDFAYDHERDLYLCPGGRKLTTTGTLVNDNATMLYRASKHDCAGCALKLKCCPSTPARKVPRFLRGRTGYGATDRQIPRGPNLSTIAQKGRDVVCPSQTHSQARSAPLRGPNSARDEFLLAAAAQNLRKLAKLIPMPSIQPA